MAEAVRRIVVTNPESPLGRGLLAGLRSDSSVEVVRGVETKTASHRPQHPGRKEGSKRPNGPPHTRRASDPDVDFVPLVPDPRPFAEFLRKETIDTVVQCDLVADRSGAGSHAVEADVIAAMSLGAAIAQEGSTVRSWVIASSTAIYPIASHSSLLQTETQQRPREEETFAASIAEAEDYARDVAHRLPHVNVAIMRLQQLVGPDTRGPLANLLAHDPIPTLIGFDPSIQLLHIEDAISALAFAAHRELAGLYNVASAGVIHWQDAVRATGHNSFPVLPLSFAMLEPMLKRLGIPFAPAELFDLMRFGHAVDIRKLERAGWKPRFDQTASLSHLAPTGDYNDAD